MYEFIISEKGQCPWLLYNTRIKLINTITKAPQIYV